MNHCPSGSSPEGFFSREFAALGEHSRRRRRIPGENMFSKTEKERRERVEDYLRRSMERYGESVYRLALCRLRSVPDAEDVCQDVFLRLLRKGDPAWDEERTKAFLLRCAVNRCADLGRQRQRRRESPWEELPDRPAEERDESRALWEAVGQLPPPQRTVIHLHPVHQLLRSGLRHRRDCGHPAHPGGHRPHPALPGPGEAERTVRRRL